MLKWLAVFVLIVTISQAQETFVMEQSVLQKMQVKYGERAKKRVIALLKMMNSLVGKSESVKLKTVNTFFNRIFYETDIKNWKVRDYWATRMEFLGKAKGDCEDYAIAKYFTLKQLGIPEKKLYITYVKLLRLKQAHMVLTYFKEPKGIPYVLDNYNFKILSATKRKDLKPVYSFNGSSLYLAKQKGLGKALPQSKQHVRWSQLLKDVKRNKLWDFLIN